MAINASRAVLRHRLMLIRRLRRLLGKRHGARRVATTALGGIILLEILPDLLRKFQPMSFVFGRRAEFKYQVAPHFSARLNVAYQARHQSGRDVALAAARLNTEHIGVMHAMPVLLEGLVHLVTGRAKGIGVSDFKSAEKGTRKPDADDESYQPAERYAEQEPTLRTPPKPCSKTPAHRLRRIHLESLNAAISNPSS